MTKGRMPQNPLKSYHLLSLKPWMLWNGCLQLLANILNIFCGNCDYIYPFLCFLSKCLFLRSLIFPWHIYYIWLIITLKIDSCYLSWRLATWYVRPIIFLFTLEFLFKQQPKLNGFHCLYRVVALALCTHSDIYDTKMYVENGLMNP